MRASPAITTAEKGGRGGQNGAENARRELPAISDQGLFDWLDRRPIRYPRAPGHRRVPTSVEAAAEIGPRAANLRARVLEVLRRGPATADETAESMGESALAVRPRFSELRVLGLVADSGGRRVNRSGRRAIVWRIVGADGV